MTKSQENFDEELIDQISSISKSFWIDNLITVFVLPKLYCMIKDNIGE